MKKTILWTAVLFLLTSITIPTIVMADGNPMPGCSDGKCLPAPPDKGFGGR